MQIVKNAFHIPACVRAQAFGVRLASGKQIYLPAQGRLVVQSAKASIAVEAAPRISNREIIERLTKLEEGQKQLETSLERRPV